MRPAIQTASVPQSEIAMAQGSEASNPLVPRSSWVMARLTLSAMGRASQDPSIWREPDVHRAILISGLSVMVSGLAQLQQDLGDLRG
jgi:hypothetical protein